MGSIPAGNSCSSGDDKRVITTFFYCFSAIKKLDLITVDRAQWTVMRYEKNDIGNGKKNTEVYVIVLNNKGYL